MSRVVAADSDAMPYVVGESTPDAGDLHDHPQGRAWDANVCIEGENGTGKELVARAVHFSGPRRDHPFVTLDCSTIAEGLIESHLFGHVKGAFTGAVSSRQGVFAQGHTGTVFIDEITRAAAAPAGQAAARHPDGRVRDGRRQPAAARRMCASSPLPTAIFGRPSPRAPSGRICTSASRSSTSRSRRSASGARTSRCSPSTSSASSCASGHRQDIRGLTPRAMNALVNYSWPGNVRQLKNWIEQALVLADGELIDLEHFPSLTREASEVMGAQAPLAPLGLRLEELERWYVLETLRRADGNRTKAARQLGISLRACSTSCGATARASGAASPMSPAARAAEATGRDASVARPRRASP